MQKTMSDAERTQCSEELAAAEDLGAVLRRLRQLLVELGRLGLSAGDIAALVRDELALFERGITPPMPINLLLNLLASEYEPEAVEGLLPGKPTPSKRKAFLQRLRRHRDAVGKLITRLDGAQVEHHLGVAIAAVYKVVRRERASN